MSMFLRRLISSRRSRTATTTFPPPKPVSMIGMGRVFISGSGIGSETSMIAANDRNNSFSTKTTTSNTSVENSNMDDEYGEMNSDGESYHHPGPYELECGDVLEDVTLRYQTYGSLNEGRDNVIVVCHALTGNASLHSWWGDLLGPNLAFDTSKYFIVCTNILGSCYGSTSPTSINPKTNTIYGMSFPDISVQDTVRLQLKLLKHHLKVNSVKCVIGGSFGGMQAVEYAAQAGTIDSEFACDDEQNQATPFVRSIIPIACGADHTAWQIAVSETQRQAIYADPKWNDGDVDFDDLPLKGLAVARQFAMVSYRTPLGYEKKFGRTIQTDGSGTASRPYGSKAMWQVKSYLEYQGQKFLTRFDPVTYVKLTEQMDTHDVGRNRGGKQNALAKVQIPVLILGIDSDILYPLKEQEELMELFENGELRVITSDAGHDGFLLEQEQVGRNIVDFLNRHD